MSSAKLHRLGSSLPDPVTGAFATRCGIGGHRDLRALPRAEGEGQAFHNEGGRFLTASSEVAVTCPKCRLKVTPSERKVLRLMLDHQSVREVIFHEDRVRFDWHRGSSLTFWKNGLYRSLRDKGLIAMDLAKGYKLTINGTLLARTYPEVIDEFDKPKKRRK